MTPDINREVEEMSEAQPKWDGLGIPRCSEDGCAQYDGKRCRLMGLRPGSLCEPAVETMSDLLNRRTP